MDETEETTESGGITLGDLEEWIGVDYEAEEESQEPAPANTYAVHLVDQNAVYHVFTIGADLCRVCADGSLRFYRNQETVETTPGFLWFPARFERLNREELIACFPTGEWASFSLVDDTDYGLQQL